MFLHLFLTSMVVVMLSGCASWFQPDCPSSVPHEVHFPTYDTTGIEKKTHTTTKGYPTYSTEGEELIIFKKKEFDIANQNSLNNVKDFNSFLESINNFNQTIKLKELQYNKEAQSKTN